MNQITIPIAALRETGLKAPNEAIAIEAARLRQRHPVSLPDACRQK